MTRIGPSAPFLAGGTVKIAYDLTLWWMLRRVKPPEEVAGRWQNALGLSRLVW